MQVLDLAPAAVLAGALLSAQVVCATGAGMSYFAAASDHSRALALYRDGGAGTVSLEGVGTGPVESETPDWPGADGRGITAPALAACGEAATLISRVQGPGFVSDLQGERHEIEAVVVGNFRTPSPVLPAFSCRKKAATRTG
ncbi:hypothetical protein [Microbulbifer spongiae]|uniref:Uncharacterized protein n=1 Tax=Microbulbifer spongiae TaxID=2944933 RepID=A0ABY9E6X9_9GAMM|nr:hypothetical protein [Microbulbifer sp. MI-G]WKD48780.1 hypothetical protein M8T91_12805 [Microbulbifer sp. MI-G]